MRGMRGNDEGVAPLLEIMILLIMHMQTAKGLGWGGVGGIITAKGLGWGGVGGIITAKGLG